MQLSVCLNVLLLSVAIVVTSAVYDYKPLRQPKTYESDCVKQWSKLSTSSSDGLDDRSIVKSSTSELRINLTVMLKRFTSDYVDFNTRSFDGLIPAPTIKLCPGDRLVVTLTNSLEAGRNNNTNLHLHGMHVPPVGEADNVIPIVEPGGQRRYTYDIRADHPAGTLWYHPHAHGNVNSQLNGMMAGTLIIVDQPADFPIELAAMDDLVMILQAICVKDCFNMFDNLKDSIENKYSSSMKDMEATNEEDEQKVWPTDLEIVEDDADIPLNDTSLPTVFVNGQYLPSLDLVVKEYKRLRFVNAIPNNVAELVTTRDSSCKLTVLAMDGIYFDKPKAKEVIVIPPGGRADVAIMCAETGEFYLETDCASSRNKLLGLVNQHRVPSQRIVKLKVMKEDDKSEESESSIVATRLPPVLPKRPAYMEDTFGSAPVIADSNKYNFEFSVWMDKEITYGVNYQTFDMANINHSMPVNELQQWELSVKDYRMSAGQMCDHNDGSSMERRLTMSSHCHTMSHPFHIHATHFQVTDIHDDTDPDGILFSVGDWRDTLPLYRGGVQIRFMPRDYMVGNIFAHCHIASHVDAGMAQLVTVYDPRTRPQGDKKDGKEDDSSNPESEPDDDDDESESDETEKEKR
ncbi:hypothetical protein KXD40_004761 [Peronospora effusa]|uniref:Plastocyanin-like domain-containing protein n=1 Tax=Peronospora effusa TaxID=542832 RepID=A0A3M6VH48_9STRA|nr:hypothetical protein DD238_004747 [Peronospora effusa]UIZ28064.1 hypothetical protein KXD40_004761 [Peronospora effusa]CAI5721149.1 unnamed protein product [Peronospora effusa]